MEAETPPQAAKGSPSAFDLFVASLLAAAIVYIVGITIIAMLVGLTSQTDRLAQGLTFLIFFATIGAGVALLVSFLIVAPLGTAWGRLVVRFTAPAWWQGPLTGLLVALSLLAVMLAIFGIASQPLDMGTRTIAAVPVILAPVAGGFVQHTILRWPTRTGPATH